MPKEINRKNFLLPFSLGLIYFNTISTFSYNTFVLVCFSIALGLLIRIPQSNFKTIISICLGFLCFLIFSARFGSGILFLALIPLAYFLLLKEKFKVFKYWTYTWGVYFLCLGLYFFFAQDKLTLMFQALGAISQSSHQDLFYKYFDQSKEFILRSVLPPLLINVIFLKYFPRKYNPFWIIYSAFFVFKYIILEFNFFKLGYYTSGFMLGIVVIEMYKSYKNGIFTKELFFYFLFPNLLFFSSSLGTNNNLFKSISLNFLLLYPLIYCFRINSIKIEILSFIIFIFSFMGIYHHQYYQTYRSLPRDKQHFIRSSYSPFKGIKISQEIEKKISDFEKKLIAVNFNKQLDRIIVFPNLPGLVSYLNLRAYGNPWNIDGYDNSYIYNCTFFRMETDTFKGKLYLYTEKGIKDLTTTCINHPFIKI